MLGGGGGRRQKQGQLLPSRKNAQISRLWAQRRSGAALAKEGAARTQGAAETTTLDSHFGQRREEERGDGDGDEVLQGRVPAARGSVSAPRARAERACGASVRAHQRVADGPRQARDAEVLVRRLVRERVARGVDRFARKGGIGTRVSSARTGRDAHLHARALGAQRARSPPAAERGGRRARTHPSWP